MHTTMFFLLLLLPTAVRAQNQKNVVLLIADDLRPELKGAYGQPWMVTPQLDKLAQESLIFDAAYTNCAICAASRNSFMSGRMPDATRTWNFIDDFRRSGLSTLPGGQTVAGTDWTSLPEFYHNQGYYTAAHGKVFHNNRPRKKDLRGLDAYSKMFKTSCPGDVLFCPGNDGPKDKSYSDFKTANKAIKTIKKVKNMNNSPPLFMAVGLHFPHITWAVPDWCVNEYDFQSLTVAENRLPPVNCPDIAFTAEFDGRPQLTLDTSQFADLEGSGVTSWPVPTPHANDVPEAVDLFLRLGYYSAITFADELFGKVLDTLENQQMKDDTLLIFTSDHGFSLGEQGEWGKHTMFDNSLRIPLMIRAPWIPGCTGRTSAFFELIDLYRTTVSLAGLDPHLIEDDVAGVDQAALISAAPAQKASVAPRDAAYAQYSRCPQHNQPEWYFNNCEEVPASQITVMGYTVRENTLRFTEWYSFTNCVADFDDIIATEVYVQQDPRLITAGTERMDFDNVGEENVVATTSASELHRLRTLIRNRFDTGVSLGCPS